MPPTVRPVGPPYTPNGTERTLVTRTRPRTTARAIAVAAAIALLGAACGDDDGDADGADDVLPFEQVQASDLTF